MILQRKLLAFSVLALLPFAGASTNAQESVVQTPNSESRAFSFVIGGGSYLGVQTENITKENFGKYNLREPRGVAVTKVVENSPAAQAGLRDGDVIVRFEGEEVKSASKLTRLIQEVAPDQKARITVLRNGSEQEITVTVGKRPEPNFREFGEGRGMIIPPTGEFRTAPLPPMQGLPRDFDFERFRVPEGENVFVFPGSAGRRIGVSVSPLTKQLGEFFGVAEGKGLLIENVSENSAASRAGLRAGDVILEVDGQAVSQQIDLIRTLTKKAEGDITLTILRDKQRQTVRLTPESPKAQTTNATKFKI